MAKNTSLKALAVYIKHSNNQQFTNIYWHIYSAALMSTLKLGNYENIGLTDSWRLVEQVATDTLFWNLAVL